MANDSDSCPLILQLQATCNAFTTLSNRIDAFEARITQQISEIRTEIRAEIKSSTQSAAGGGLRKKEDKRILLSEDEEELPLSEEVSFLLKK